MYWNGHSCNILTCWYSLIAAPGHWPSWPLYNIFVFLQNIVQDHCTGPLPYRPLCIFFLERYHTELSCLLMDLILDHCVKSLVCIFCCANHHSTTNTYLCFSSQSSSIPTLDIHSLINSPFIIQSFRRGNGQITSNFRIQTSWRFYLIRQSPT